MLRMKLVLLGLAATLVFSAVVSSSAMAAPETRFFVEGSEVTAATKIVGTSGVAQLESTVAGLKILIECKKDTFTGEIEEKGKTKGEVTFEECKLYEIKAGKKTEVTTCTVPNIKFTFHDQLVVGNGSSAEDEYFPPTGKLYIEFEITGTCLLAKKYKVETANEGKGQRCALPLGEVEQEKHEIVCTSTGSSELRFGANEKASFFSTEFVLLTTKKVWRS